MFSLYAIETKQQQKQLQKIKSKAESPFTKKLFDTCKEWTFKTNSIELLFYLKPQ